jgi:thioredoxin reductase
MKRTRIAVIGAGPTGLEAALAFVRRGDDVIVYEAGRVGEHLRRFEWVRLFTPFEMNSSEAGRERVSASGAALPAKDAILTAGELADVYLEPLARIPELHGRVRERTRVTAIGREGLTKGQGIVASGDRSRVGRPFLLRLAEAGRPERFERADLVIDASGVYTTPRATGPGGLPALGEDALGDRIERHIPDLRGPGRARLGGRRVLLVGHGHSAATALLDLQALADEGDAAKVTWVHRGTTPGADPFPVVADDALPERRALALRANAIAREARWLSRRAGAVIESYESVGTATRVTLRDESGAASTLDVDRVLALTGYRPDTSLARELQVHLCYASEAPMALATALLTAALKSPAAAGDCLSQTAHGAETLRTPEPGYFVLGAKSYGRNSNFILSIGRKQIEEVATLLDAESTQARAPIAAP